MIVDKRIFAGTKWHKQVGTYLSRARQLLKPLLLIAVWGLLLLVAMYIRPLVVVQDVGVGLVSMTGLYESERSGALSYAYTAGDATVRFPETGGGRFIAGLRMGGPGGATPVMTRLVVADQQADLGRVQRIRTYRLLIPADAQGTVVFRLLSEKTRVERDWRPIGLLLDRVELRSVGPTTPTGLVALSMLVVFGLAGGAVSQLRMPYRRRVLLLLIVGSGLGLGYGLGRGRVPLQVWWELLGASLVAAAVLRLSRFEGRRFARPIYGVATLFVAWRVALWLFAALGVWHSDLFDPLHERIEHDGTAYTGAGVSWDALVAGWVHWDGRQYIEIASTGYQFYGERWPNIAFFPFYPTLIQAAAPLTGYHFDMAALLVAHLALFGTLLLLYDLIAQDFGYAVAYRSLLFLLVVPTSFFFVAPYSESLALALLVAALWAIRRQRWWLAGGVGFLLALTRLPGMLIAPILAVAYLQHLRWRWRDIRPPVLAALLPPLGLGLFMLFQWQRFGTPFAFLLAQQRWKNQLSPPWVIPERLWTAMTTLPSWPLATFQAIFWVGFIVLTIAVLRRLPLLYSLTMLLFLLPPYLSSWPWSISRHVLLAFPACVVLAQWAERRWARTLLVAGMLLLLMLATCLFVNGFLVA